MLERWVAFTVLYVGGRQLSATTGIWGRQSGSAREHGDKGRGSWKRAMRKPSNGFHDAKMGRPEGGGRNGKIRAVRCTS